MAVTYINRKGTTYVLCRTTTAPGRVRYHFAREPKGEPVDVLPAGYTIRESVNGVVSLVRDQPPVFSAEELHVVEAAVRRHPKASRYRVDARGGRITVYERRGPAADELAAVLSEVGLPFTDVRSRIEEHLERAASYEPVLHFHLVDAAGRHFGVERRSYSGSSAGPGNSGSGDEWLALGLSGSLDALARRVVPLLGTNAYFALW